MIEFDKIASAVYVNYDRSKILFILTILTGLEITVEEMGWDGTWSID